MPDNVITDSARNLRQRLEDYERITIEDVRTWLTEEGLTPGNINMVLGYGQVKTRKWWHKEDDELVVGAASAALQAETDDLPTEDPLAMDNPQDAFEIIARKLGVPKKPAQTAAFYCFNNFDMTDAAKAWEAIRSTQIPQSLKKQVYSTWINHNSIEPPEELLAEINKTSSPHRNGNSPVGRPATRYVVTASGEIRRTDADDDGGLPLSAAVYNSDNKLKAEQGNGRKDDAILAAALTSMSSIITAAMAPRDGGTKEMLEWIKILQEESRAQRDAQREETKLMIQAQQEQAKLSLEMLALRQNAAMDKVTQALEAMNSNPFDAIRNLFPNGDEILTRLFSPPSHNTIKLGEGEVSFDTWLQIKEQERKDGMFAVVRQAIPQFIEMGTDLAAATRRLTASPEVMAPEPSPVPQGYRVTNCAGCQASLAYNPEDPTFACPECGARQSAPRLLALETESQDQDGVRQPKPVPPPTAAKKGPTVVAAVESEEVMPSPMVPLEPIQQEEKEEEPSYG